MPLPFHLHMSIFQLERARCFCLAQSGHDDLWGLYKGEPLDAIQIAASSLPSPGSSSFVFPSLSAPPLIGSILMLGAGVAWGIYSLRGKREENPGSVTAGILSARFRSQLLSASFPFGGYTSISLESATP